MELIEVITSKDVIQQIKHCLIRQIKTDFLRIQKRYKAHCQLLFRHILFYKRTTMQIT